MSVDSDQDTVRAAYISIVKIVHPDSGHREASAERFAQVDNAFRILQAKYAKERRGIPDDHQSEVKEFDIKVKCKTRPLTRNIRSNGDAIFHSIRRRSTDSI